MALFETAHIIASQTFDGNNFNATIVFLRQNLNKNPMYIGNVQHAVDGLVIVLINAISSWDMLFMTQVSEY